MGNVKPKVMAGGLGGMMAGLIMGIVQQIWPEIAMPAGVEGFLAAVVGFILGWFKKE